MPRTQTVSSQRADSTTVLNRLAAHKHAIDNELRAIATAMLQETGEQYGSYPQEVVCAFTNVLLNGGKRVRGALVIESYLSFGGSDSQIALRTAAAIEFLNTYLLVADDIQDRSLVRRGGPTAHAQLTDFHKKHHFNGDADHFGQAAAITSFLIAQHYASNIILDLPVPADVIAKVLKAINDNFIVTGYGQTLDIFGSASPQFTTTDSMNALTWKTAYYTFVNPIQVGAILAGAPDAALEQLQQYGVSAGRVFQLTDDIIGIFGSSDVTGKNPLDDLKEGKKSILIAETLKRVSPKDKRYILHWLGNDAVGITELNQCKQIIERSGALEAVRALAAAEAAQAVQSVSSIQSLRPDSIHFFADLATYLLNRKK